MQLLRLTLVVYIAGFIAAGCTSRTLPLPPPVVSRVSSPDSDGWVSLSGFSLEGASIGVVNDRTLDGVIVTSPEDDCGSVCPWQARIQAEASTNLRVWQFFETEGGIDVNVPKPPR